MWLDIFTFVYTIEANIFHNKYDSNVHIVPLTSVTNRKHLLSNPSTLIVPSPSPFILPFRFVTILKHYIVVGIQFRVIFIQFNST